MSFFPCMGMMVLAASAVSCASIGARQSAEKHQPFVGVRNATHYLLHPSLADQPGVQFMNLFDLPFSTMVDTILIPYDLAQRRQAKATTTGLPKPPPPLATN